MRFGLNAYALRENTYAAEIKALIYLDLRLARKDHAFLQAGVEGPGRKGGWRSISRGGNRVPGAPADKRKLPGAGHYLRAS
ncbi:MAG: hypothetical protein D6765_04040 [Bacteroidetes bacterium]|nr:MAG: hypothetical protein D6765_04040 [Bacteroidota bacterium]